MCSPAETYLKANYSHLFIVTSGTAWEEIPRYKNYFPTILKLYLSRVYQFKTIFCRIYQIVNKRIYTPNYTMKEFQNC